MSDCCFDVDAILADIPAAIAAGTLTADNASRIGMSREEFAIAASLNPQAAYTPASPVACCFDVQAILDDIPGAIASGDLNINTASRIGLSRGGFALASALIQSSGGGGTWGSITGTLSDQTDLQTALDGKLSLTGGTVTGQLVLNNASATGALNLAPVWNNIGTAFAGIYMRASDTASNSASRLLSLGTGANERAAIFKGGSVAFGQPGTNGWAVQINGTINTIGRPAGDGTLNGGTEVLEWVSNNNEMVVRGVLSLGTTYAARDTSLRRVSAGVIGQRNGTSPQEYQLYNTYTDASNYERLALQSGSGYFEVAAETAGTGTDNIDLRLTPAGTGRVMFGSHSAVGAEVVTGYITIKDAGGTERKIAVIS